MQPVLTAAEMRDADRRTIEEIGLPGAVLMENAGAAVASAILERFPRARHPLVLCGRGNNGGDGYVVARRLRALQPAVVLVGARSEVAGDARLHMGVLERSGIPVVEASSESAWRERLAGADLIVDALLGTGLRQRPEGLAAAAIADLVLAAEGGTPVVAVDIPSGVPSDTGELDWPAVRATLTVTFAALKYGHVLPPACDHVGELRMADIGIPEGALHRAAGPGLWLIELADVAAVFGPARPRGAHKGTFGHVLVIGGSTGKTGAAVLAAHGALVSGAGLVTIATPSVALPLVVAAARAEVMAEPLPCGADGELDHDALPRAIALASSRDAVVLGPGLGQSAAARAFARELARECPVPVVIDADGLNALVRTEHGASPLERLPRARATVLTPHPGEMARLAGITAAEVQRRRLETVRSLAVSSGVVAVLKGQRTLVADAEGHAAVNPTGNPGMATAGTGDVLAGMIGALLARGTGAYAAAAAAVHLHGAAGDLAAGRVGEESLLAGDLVASVPDALARARAG